MKTVTVLSRQTLLDIAMEYCGSADAVYEIARINELSPTAMPVPGVTLRIPEPVNAKIVQHYSVHGVVPATALTDEAFGYQWSDPQCSQEAFFYSFQWSDSECVQTEPCIAAWTGTVCCQEAGAYRHLWEDAVCVTLSTTYQISWGDLLCVKEQPYAFIWSHALCEMTDGPYGFVWDNSICVMTEGAYGFVWSNPHCAQYYDSTLEWGSF